MNLLLNIINTKKVIIPGVNIKEMAPLAAFVSPKDLIVTISLISILSQISETFRYKLELKEIQNIPSVKFYSKIINNCTSTISLSTTFSIAKSLGPELEILSSLNTSERYQFIYLLKKSIINEKISGRISSKSRIFQDPFELLRYRKGLSMQTRSIMLATAIFLPNSITIGLPINQINIELILESAYKIWAYWGFSYEEFDFLLRKEAMYNFNSLKKKNHQITPNTIKDSVRIVFLSTLKEIASFEDKIEFSEDNVLFKTNENLTLLEKDFGFINRTMPDIPENFSNFDYNLEDKLIRVAFNQRKNLNYNTKNFIRSSLRKEP